MAVLTLAESAARTTSGASAGVNAPGGHDEVSIFVHVTAVSGTSPTATFAVEWSNDGTTWFTADPAENFSTISAAAAVVKLLKTRGDFMRLAWVLGGTAPSFTFSAQANVTDFD